MNFVFNLFSHSLSKRACINKVLMTLDMRILADLEHI